MIKNRTPNRKPLIIGLLLIIVAAVVIGLIIKHRSTPTVSVITTKKSTATKNNTRTAGSSDKIPASTGFSTPSSADKTAASATLTPPSGTLVSNHRPNIGGSSDASSEQSVCNTSPGASCYIKFTNGSTVKQLPAQTADASGAVYWTWDVKQAGLSTGSWQIQAVASLNGQTQTFTDSLNLEVQP